MKEPEIEYIPDALVRPELDGDLRQLLSLCFGKPGNDVFRDRRYFRQPPQHRWLLRPAVAAVAHLAVHEKYLGAAGEVIPVGGIAEVCVHPDYRRRGYVKALLEVVHPWRAEHGFCFAVLFGKPAVYGSSGYRVVGNLWADTWAVDGSPSRAVVKALVRPLGDRPWPADPVYLPGPTF